MPEPDDVDIWISEGERAARHVAERALVLVTGDSVAAAALVALGVARAEAATRRVAVIDLAGDVPPLRELVTDEDPHGVVDTILHGVSLARVSRQVDDAGHMFVIPTGTQPPDEFVVGHTRWQRLRATFRETHALALVVASRGTPALDSLAAKADGVIVVGKATTSTVFPNVLATLPADGSGVPAGVAAAAAEATPGSGAAADVPADPPVRVDEAVAPSDLEQPITPRLRGMAAMGGESRRTALWVALAVLAVALAGWFLSRGSGDSEAGEQAVATGAGGQQDGSVADGSLTEDSMPGTVVDFRESVAAVNPADSARATAFSVELVSATSQESAWQFLVNSPAPLPASSVSPVVVEPDATRWFRVVAGAYSVSSRADSLLRAAHTAGVVASDAGRVVRTPVALRVGEGLGASAARQMVGGLRQRGIGAYALTQDDGSLNVYVGAFEQVAQAQYLSGRLRDDGVENVIAYRTGRLD